MKYRFFFIRLQMKWKMLELCWRNSIEPSNVIRAASAILRDGILGWTSTTSAAILKIPTYKERGVFQKPYTITSKVLISQDGIVMGDRVPEYVTRQRAAAELCMCDDTFDKYVKVGVLPSPKRRGGLTRWKWSEIEAAIDRGPAFATKITQDAFEEGIDRVKKADA